MSEFLVYCKCRRFGDGDFGPYSGPLVIGKIIHFFFNTDIKMTNKGVRTNDYKMYIYVGWNISHPI